MITKKMGNAILADDIIAHNGKRIQIIGFMTNGMKGVEYKGELFVCSVKTMDTNYIMLPYNKEYTVISKN